MPQATEDRIPAKMNLIKMCKEQRDRLSDEEYNKLEERAL